MPVIQFRRAAPGPAGDVPATGFFRFRLNKPLTIPGDPDTVVTTAPFTAALTGGAADVTLAPTPAGYAWQVFESIDGIPDLTYWVTVPGAAGPFDDGDLPRVNPSTLAPAAAPVAAWWETANATITAAEIVGNDLILTRHDGTAVNAGQVRATPDELAAAAATAAADAVPAGAAYVFVDTDGRPYFE